MAAIFFLLFLSSEYSLLKTRFFPGKNLVTNFDELLCDSYRLKEGSCMLSGLEFSSFIVASVMFVRAILCFMQRQFDPLNRKVRYIEAN